MPLTDIQIKKAKLEGDAKTRKLYDTGGLCLRISASGKYWIFEYDVPGSIPDPSKRKDGQVKRKTKRTTPSLGSYPDVTLSEARQKREEMRKQIKAGIDPAQARKSAKYEAQERTANTFELVAREWHGKQGEVWTASHHKLVLRIMSTYLFPVIGNIPIASVTAPELLRALRPIETRGALETAHRARTIASQVFRYAIATGRADRDVGADLRGALSPLKVKHHAAITDPAKVGELMRAIDGYEGTLITKCALRLLPLVFTRPGEVRHMEWSEIDTAAALWSIPAGKMKMREDHIVPLSTQALAILAEVRELTGGGKYAFPGERSRARPMSENTINAALRRLGYSKDQITGHGFRAMARTLLDEALGFRVDYIEQQLAHTVKDPLGRAYNRTKHLDERRRMMQAWADYLDSLRDTHSQKAKHIKKA